MTGSQPSHLKTAMVFILALAGVIAVAAIVDWQLKSHFGLSMLSPRHISGFVIWLLAASLTGYYYYSSAKVAPGRGRAWLLSLSSTCAALLCAAALVQWNHLRHLNAASWQMLIDEPGHVEQLLRKLAESGGFIIALVGLMLLMTRLGFAIGIFIARRLHDRGQDRRADIFS